MISVRLSILAILFFTATSVFAADYSIRPFLIDETFQPRDVITRDILITNESNSLLRLYATVNEITVGTDGEILEYLSPIEGDRTQNVAGWIEITRGRINIPPGEATTTAVTFRINPSAVEGEYQAYIGFTDTSKRYIAEEAALAGDAPGLPVKLTIADTAVTDLSIHRFRIPRFIFSDLRKFFELTLSNNGEITEVPSGEIIIYDSRGEEVAATLINTEKDAVGPEEELEIESALPIGNDIGRYRANLVVKYGEKNLSTLNGSADFFLIPWYLLLLLLALIILFSVVVTYLLKRSFDEHMIVEQEEVDLHFYDNSGHRSKDKDHDITLKK